MNERRQLPSHPPYYAAVSGDLVSRVNLLKFIREWARAHEILSFSVVEFGVLNGESLIEIIRQLRGGIAKIVGFDTFSGIPQLLTSDHNDLVNMPAFIEGNYQGGRVDDVMKFILGCTDLPSEKLELIEGDFRETVSSYELGTSGDFPLIFHVDVDLYSSSLEALKWVARNAQDGSWLLLDDYWCYRGNASMGQRKAFNEVFDTNSRIEATPYTNYKGFGRAYILNIK